MSSPEIENSENEDFSDDELLNSDLESEDGISLNSSDDDGIMGDEFLLSDTESKGKSDAKSEGSVDESATEEKRGWAKVIQAVLHTKKPMLSKALLDQDMAIPESREHEVEVVNPDTGEPVAKAPTTKKTIRMLRKQAMEEKMKKKLKKTLWEKLAHQEISEEDVEKERRLRLMAKMAYIQFCKEVGKHQKDLAASVSKTADGKIKLTEGSEAFAQNDRFLKNFDKSVKKNDTWDVLTDKYMLEDNDMEGWDLKEDGEEPTPQPKKKRRFRK